MKKKDYSRHLLLRVQNNGRVNFLKRLFIQIIVTPKDIRMTIPKE